MGFCLTDEQREFRDMARRFAEKTIRPAAAEADEREEVPWDILQKAQQAGLITYPLPEKYGGGGVESVLTKAIVDEEIFWGCAGIATIMGGAMLAATPIMLAGTEAQKEKYVSRLCQAGPEGRPALGAYALTEPGAGSDPAGMITNARREKGRYILNGFKTFITNAGIADVYVVFATVDPSRGTDGITAFIVEKDWKGVLPGKKEKKMGIRASHTASLSFEDVEVPAENRLGAEGEGFKIAMRTFDITRSHIAAGAVGIARAAYEYALAYAHERRQFGKPIFSFQAVSFMLAEMAMQIDAARLLTWRAAWLYDNGQSCTTEASMAKAAAADVAMKVTTDAVQILGGYGYMREYPVEKWMRDAKIMQIYEGTAQIQRLIVARRLKP
ncbi:MAG: acyl-CoA dehydrogenase family protein [Chloroflexi bacterium]|nr:acyl-CoA dehydrogenase family protein [Chloroflexota bacterium]MBI5291786.1 acyl-CoA dehydrogenase family protein [Chloroflexota bacterium]